MIDKTVAQRYLRNVLSLEQHIYEAIDQQIHQDTRKQQSEASKLLSKAAQVLRKHVTELEKYFGTLGEVVLLKEDISLPPSSDDDKVSPPSHEKLSEFLRNDYGAICLAIISYVKIEAIGLALQADEISGLAEKHLMELKPLIERIEYIMPLVVAQELAMKDEVVEATPEGQHVIWSTPEL
jgi:hypothetical protein